MADALNLDHWLRLENTTILPIPDNAPEGAVSSIPCSQSGLVQALEVAVDIEHEFVGDLELVLLAPGGTSAVLQSRAGGRNTQIQRQYTFQDTPSLAALRNLPSRTSQEDLWRLRVSDLNAGDTGKLRGWKLGLLLAPSTEVPKPGPEPGPGPVPPTPPAPTPPAPTPPALAPVALHLEGTVEQPIPDGSPAGLTHTLTVNQAGTVQTLAVSVDLTHPFGGDLRLSLTAPNGRTVVLFDRQGGSTPGLQQTFTAQEVPDLAALLQTSALGNWQLRVADLIAGDVGQWHGWALALEVA